MPDWILPVILGAIATSGVWLSVLVTKRSNDRKQLADEVSGYRAEVRALTTRQDTLNARNFTLINYASILRAHIDRGDPPPSPPWPEGLYD